MKLADAYNTSALRPRAYLLGGLFIFLIALLLVRLWYLQIWRGEEYRNFSDRNRFKVVEISAPRGKIFDRNGRLLADNRPRFDVHFIRGFSVDVESEMLLLKDIFQWSDEEYQAQLIAVEKSAPYRGARLARDASWSQLARLEARTLDLSGVDIQVLAVRDYLYGDAFFHSIGYTGEVGDHDLRYLRQSAPELRYRLGDQIGISGMERMYEHLLRGRDGRRFVVVDVRGRPVQQEESALVVEESLVPAQAGSSLRLSFDLELQLETIRALGDRRAAAIAMDPQTGQILAMVSRPAIDPNIFTQFVSRQRLRELRERPDKPFLDRNLGEHYPPGSTFKLVMALAALEEGVIRPDTILNSPGSFRFGRRTWHDHNRAGFGQIDLREAIQKSSNVFFFQVGLDLGLDKMFYWSRSLGLGRLTWPGHEVFSDRSRPQERLRRFNFEQPGHLSTSSWVRRLGNTTLGAETINAGIGQGGYLVTTTQLARMLSVIANGGKIFQPQFVLESMTSEGEKMRSFEAILENTVEINESYRHLILDAMGAVVNEPGGTAGRARIRGVRVGGKTGTSQVVSLSASDEDEENVSLQAHALFVGVAPVENPQIVVAIVVEHGASGGRAAAPVARQMIQNYLSRMQPERSPSGRNPGRPEENL